MKLSCSTLLALAACAAEPSRSRVQPAAQEWIKAEPDKVELKWLGWEGLPTQPKRLARCRLENQGSTTVYFIGRFSPFDDRGSTAEFEIQQLAGGDWQRAEADGWSYQDDGTRVRSFYARSIPDMFRVVPLMPGMTLEISSMIERSRFRHVDGVRFEIMMSDSDGDEVVATTDRVGWFEINSPVIHWDG